MPAFTRDGATIHYSDTGVPAGRPDAPTVFFGHGLLFSGWMFHPQIGALQNEYRCVAIDGADREEALRPKGATTWTPLPTTPSH